MLKRTRYFVSVAIFLGGTLGLYAQSTNIEVATVKPSDPQAKDEWFTVRDRHFMTINTPVSDLLRYAFGLSEKQLEGAPDWVSHERFDIDALTSLNGPISDAQKRMMTQEILTQRFHLRFHREKKELPIYALTIAKGGPKLKKTSRSPQDNADFYGPRGELIVNNATMSEVASGLSRGLVDRPVDDQTGLTDRYDFDLKWNPDEGDNTIALPGFYKAFEEQLGLKLTATKGMMPVLVVDEISRPSPN